MKRPINCIMLNNEIIKHLVFKEYLRYNDISRHIVKWKQRNRGCFDFIHTHAHIHAHYISEGMQQLNKMKRENFSSYFHSDLIFSENFSLEQKQS